MAKFRSSTTVSISPAEVLAVLVKAFDLPEHTLDDGDMELGPRMGAKITYYSEREEKSR